MQQIYLESYFKSGYRRFMNYNRVIQRQYIDWHYQTLVNPREFNQGLMEYLVWYNTEKPHKRLGKIPPLKYYLDNFVKLPQKSNMLWTLARCLQMINFVILSF